MELSLLLEIQNVKANYKIDLFTNISKDKEPFIWLLTTPLHLLSIPIFICWEIPQENQPFRKCDLLNLFLTLYIITSNSSPSLNSHDLPVPTAQISSMSFSEADV